MNNKKKTAVIIAAAGTGKRMGSSIPKQYLKIGGEPILLKSIRAFCDNKEIDSHDKCIKKYLETGNTEYLCDAANYLMFEYMYPQKEGAYFEATDSEGSAGVSGTPINELLSPKDNFDFLTRR